MATQTRTDRLAGVTLILVDRDPRIVRAWRDEFGQEPNVEIRQGDMFASDDYNGIIAAGNGFGLMDGGIDGVISRAYPAVADRVQQVILDEYAGELPVGSCVTVPANDDEQAVAPTLFYPPTMRLPGDVSRTENVYYAFKAALLAIDRHNRRASGYARVTRVVCAGLGTGAGFVRPEVAAAQMMAAYLHVTDPLRTISWHEASLLSGEIEETLYCCATPSLPARERAQMALPEPRALFDDDEDLLDNLFEDVDAFLGRSAEGSVTE